MPLEVIKSELGNNGFRVCALTKKKVLDAITVLWQYNKHKEIPFRYLFEEHEDE